MSNFLENLKTFENTTKNLVLSIKEDDRTTHQISLNDSKVVKSLRGKIVLDPKLDPDPYGYHGLPLAYRLECMGWS